MKNKMWKFPNNPIVFLLILLALTGCIQGSGKPTACTMDAKICPDGSAVGRVPPDCEFAPCQDGEQTPCTDGETKTSTCPDGITKYLSENCVDGEWVTVQYIRNPCEPVKSVETCDAKNPCPEGWECYKFEDQKTPICWTGNPCDRCESGSCAIAESYPPQVFCQ